MAALITGLIMKSISFAATVEKINLVLMVGVYIFQGKADTIDRNYRLESCFYCFHKWILKLMIVFALAKSGSVILTYTDSLFSVLCLPMRVCSYLLLILFVIRVQLF